jgi:RNA polymerase sigma-70 factor, ECF subfamily
MSRVSCVDSPEGMLEFFLSASEEVHRYVSRLTGGDQQLTEDIVQETFIALMLHHRAGNDAVMGVGWLMTTARNRLIDHVRSRLRERVRIERHTAGDELDVPPIDLATISADQARWMLAQLPLRERVALALHTLDGQSVAEVAVLLDRSVEATTSLLARARRRLRSVVLETSNGR